MPEKSESERYLAAMGRWGTWGDDLFAMSHLLRRPIYIVTDRENDDEALMILRTPYHDFEGNVGRTHIHYLPWVQALRSVSALVKDLAPSGWTFEQEWKHVMGNMGDLARTGCHCVLLESWNLSKQNSDAQVKQLQFSPRTWPGTRWPVCTTVQTTISRDRTRSINFTWAVCTSISRRFHTYVCESLHNKQVDLPKYNVRSPHCKSAPFQFCVFLPTKNPKPTKIHQNSPEKWAKPRVFKVFALHDRASNATSSSSYISR